MGKCSESVQSNAEVYVLRPVTHAQTWASYSAVYQFCSLSHGCSKQATVLSQPSVVSQFICHIDGCPVRAPISVVYPCWSCAGAWL